MKNLLIFLALLIPFSSCTEDALMDIKEFSENDYFSPPEWIQGKWSGSYADVNGKIIEEIYLFTKDDFIVNGVSYKERIIKIGDENLNCFEECSSSVYLISVRSKLFTENYIFSILLENEIECTFGKGVNDDWEERFTENYVLTKMSDLNTEQ